MADDGSNGLVGWLMRSTKRLWRQPDFRRNRSIHDGDCRIAGPAIVGYNSHCWNTRSVGFEFRKQRKRSHVRLHES